MTKQLIVLTRVEMDGMEPTGRYVMRDKNWFPECKPARAARAMVFSSCMADIHRASAYASKEGYDVLVMDDTDDVLDRARAMASERWKRCNTGE